MSIFVFDIPKSAIPCVKTGTSIDEALKIMEYYKITHLPIVNNEDYLGLISEDDLLCNEDTMQPIGGLKLTVQGAEVEENANIFDIMNSIYQNNLSLVPIVDDKKRFVGVVLASSVLHAISDLLSVNNPGGIIILEMNVVDYSLTQISNIVEANESSIITSFIHTVPNTTLMRLVLKINNPDLGAILQAFERYDYNVIASFGQDMMDDIIKDRYEMLMRYLNL